MKKINKKITTLMAITILVLLLLPFTTTADKPVQTSSLADIEIETPQEGNLYIMGAQFFPLPLGWTVILGPITIRAAVTGVNGFEVDFYVDDKLISHDSNAPFEAAWWDISFGRHTLKVELTGHGVSDEIQVFKIF